MLGNVKNFDYDNDKKDRSTGGDALEVRRHSSGNRRFPYARNVNKW